MNTHEIPKRSNINEEEQKAFWHHIIDEQKSSGVSIAKFCQQHQISISRFRYVKYGKKGMVAEGGCCRKDVNVKAKGVGFIPVHVVEDALPDKLEIIGVKDERIKISFKNRHSVEIPVGIGEGTLLAIIKQIAQLPC